jgi:hypothetical protein
MQKRIISLFIIAMAFAAFCQFNVKGRIALSSDGNYHDRDDICATAVTIAIFASAGVADQLVYYGHSDHIWETNAGREEEMRKSSEETAKKYGGFNMDVFFNAKQETSDAINALAAEINASSADDPLWLIGAGPMEVIGRAINKSQQNKRQFVTVISHSNWNNEHAAEQHNGYHFNDFPGMGAKTKKIKDQNGGLNEPYSDFHWMRDSNNPNLKWLWDRGQAADKDKYDCSDCGMAYWLITGGMNGGDENGNPQKVKTLLENPTPIQFSDILSKDNNPNIIIGPNRIGKLFINGYSGEGMVNILNLKNQVIQKVSLQNGQAVFNLSGNAMGVYILYLSTAVNTFNQRIILK